MAHLLFDQDEKLGEVANWKLTLSEPVYKNVLGKEVLMPATKDVCSFVTPKPVHRKSQLTIIEHKKRKLVLQVQSVKGMTVTAFVISTASLK